MGKVVAFRGAQSGGRSPSRRRRCRLPPARWLAAGVGGFLIVGIVSLEFALRAAWCGIKGNATMNTSERVYHVPGQEFCGATKINFLRGERYFCSEAAARAAGWRRSLK